MTTMPRTLILGLLSVFAFGALSTVAFAAAPNWDITGNYVVDHEYSGTQYPHNVSFTQDGSGNLSGNGSSGAYMWVIDTGTVDGDVVDFTAHYTATADAVTPLTVMDVTATVAPDGSMSGTWSDNYQGTPRSGAWTAPAGSATAIPVAVTDTYADPAGSDSYDCLTPGTACATIAAAIAKVDAGGTVHVAAGTYGENIIITKAVTLSGANEGTAGSDTRGAESIVDGTDTDAAFAIRADDVTIDGFTIQNGSNGSYFSGIWSETGTQGLTIQNNVITQNGMGVWAQCGGNCLIADNLFDGNNKPGPSGGAAISADSTTDLAIVDNEFKNHTQNNPILLQAGGSGHLNVEISDNSFHDNSYSLVYVMEVTGGTFSGNTLASAAGSTGFYFDGANTNITVTDNVWSQGGYGVKVDDFYSIGDNSSIVVNNNSFEGVTVAGVEVISAYSGGPLNATGNWWGAKSGPNDPVSGDGSVPDTNAGTGSAAVGAVDYSSFCKKADCTPLTHSVTYTVEGDGTITGNTSQTVNDGDNGTSVTAVPNDGSRFDSWSDGNLSPTRSESNVTEDKTFIARFASQGSSGGGGGSSSRSRSDNGGGNGQVLGATTNAGEGCQPGDRFSTETGQACAGTETYTFTRNLYRGMPRNPDVARLQAFLVNKGYSIPDAVTDFFGAQTFAAVQAFQRDRGVPQTGFVGPLTRAELNKG